MTKNAEAALLDLAYARDIPLVATNPANFAEPHMHSAHDAMLCIANSSHIEAEDRPHSNRNAFVKSAAMMEELFGDLPEALQNTLTIAQRCAFAPPYRKPILPSLAGDLEGEARMLADRVRAFLRECTERHRMVAASVGSLKEDLNEIKQPLNYVGIKSKTLRPIKLYGEKEKGTG